MSDSCCRYVPKADLATQDVFTTRADRTRINLPRVAGVMTDVEALSGDYGVYAICSFIHDCYNVQVGFNRSYRLVNIRLGL